jgi:phosphoketolase
MVVDPRPLKLPDWREYTLDNSEHGEIEAQDMTVFGKWTRDVIVKKIQITSVSLALMKQCLTV